jgi:hypothetical protein
MINATVTSGGTNFGYNLIELNHDMSSSTGAGWYYDDVTFRAANDPWIIEQPVSQSANEGQAASFTTVAVGTAYQWQFNGANIASATASSYNITSVAATNFGSYACVVRGTNGSITTSQAVLTVTGPPAIVAEPMSLIVTQGQDASFSVTSSGSVPLSFQWQFNASPIPGATATNYDVADAQPTDAGSYTVVITNAQGSITSSVATLTVLVPPSITNQPQSQTILAGTCANFSVAATGSVPLSYQWQWNSAPQAGATGSSYTACNAGSYSVLVSNLAGVMLSGTATLTLTNPSPPAGGHFDLLSLLGDGSLELNMSGMPNTNYNLLFTTDWTNWTYLATLSGTNGLFQYNDPSVATNTDRFYRLQVAP